MSNNLGKLYVVATPIGNLADFSARGVRILQEVDLIAAEDTRHVRMLLHHYGISNKVVSLHQHNEDKVSASLLAKLQQGFSIAMVSDAGTPLLSDPGLPLVKMAKEMDIEVSPIPGACALIAALSASGLSTNRFIFEGFLPRTSSARRTFFKDRVDSPLTWVFYESSHRILYTLRDMLEILPAERTIVIAREMTKLHETIIKTSIQEALTLVEQDENMRKGEFVVIVDADKRATSATELTVEHKNILSILLKELSTKKAAALAAEITGARKNDLYRAALEMKAN
jgi:16S rRNA (cytidine1402-2'-O)-methyltransferase